MFSHPELGSDPPIKSDRESGRDMRHSLEALYRRKPGCGFGYCFYITCIRIL